VGVYLYRCESCGTRFFRKRRHPEKKQEAHKDAQKITAANLLARGSQRRKKESLARRRRDLLLYGFGILAFLLFLYYVTHEHNAESGG
jgi:hypothetical protein